MKRIIQNPITKWAGVLIASLLLGWFFATLTETTNVLQGFCAYMGLWCAFLGGCLSVYRLKETVTIKIKKPFVLPSVYNTSTKAVEILKRKRKKRKQTEQKVTNEKA